MKLLHLPVWLFIRLITPILPSKHPWKNKKFTLTEWANGATDLSLAVGVLFWGNFISMSIVLTYVILRIW